MNFTVSRNDFMDSFKVVASTLSSADNISSSVLFRTRYGQVEMLTFNGTIRSMSPVLVTNLVGDTPFCIEGKRLNLLLNAIQGNDELSVSFDADSKIVSFKGSGGVQKFKTIDPSGFPIFDAKVDLNEIEPTAQVRADVLARAFKVARMFTDPKNLKPEFKTIRMKDGGLFSTDRSAISSIEVPGIEGIEAYLTGDMSKSAESFLSKFKDQMMSIICMKDSIYYMAPDGAVFGESFPPAQLTKGFPETGDPVLSWSVSKADLEEAFQWLRAGADWTLGLRANLVNQNGNLLLECDSAAGDSITRLIESSSADEGASKDIKFTMNLDSLSRIFDVSGDVVTIEVSAVSTGGTPFYCVGSSIVDEIGNSYKFLIAQEVG